MDLSQRTYFEESEIMTNNEQFITDGGGSFRDLGDALRPLII